MRNNGDTLYTFAATANADSVFGLDTAFVCDMTYSISGASGNDTIQYVGTENVVIDLVVGGRSWSLNDISVGYSIVDSSVIENAIGASGQDLLLGNSADNVLTGRNGADELNGRDGDDTLRGGAGHDYLVGGNGADRFVFSNGNDEIADFNASEGDVLVGAWPV